MVKFLPIIVSTCGALQLNFLGILIDLYNDDIMGAFLQINFWPNIARANVSIHQTVMILAIAMHFGKILTLLARNPQVTPDLILWYSYNFNWLHMFSMNMESLYVMSWPSTLKQWMKKDGCQIRPPIDEFTFNVTHLSCFFPFIVSKKCKNEQPSCSLKISSWSSQMVLHTSKNWKF